MKHDARRAAFTLFVGVLAAACGGSAFTTGGGSADGGTSPVDATADTGLDAGVDSSTDSGLAGNDSGADARVDSGPTSCQTGSQCSTGYCKAGVCTPCTINAQCGTDQFCDAIAGACKPTKGNGVACLGPGECTSGFCADGVCCNVVCSNTCVACNTPSAPGTCSPVAQGGNNPSRPCAAGEVCCNSGVANGESCVDTSTSLDNCGMCGRGCGVSGTGTCETAQCSGGNCGITFKTAGTPCGDGGTCSAAGVCL